MLAICRVIVAKHWYTKLKALSCFQPLPSRSARQMLVTYVMPLVTLLSTLGMQRTERCNGALDLSSAQRLSAAQHAKRTLASVVVGMQRYIHGFPRGRDFCVAVQGPATSGATARARILSA